VIERVSHADGRITAITLTSKGEAPWRPRVRCGPALKTWYSVSEVRRHGLTLGGWPVCFMSPSRRGSRAGGGAESSQARKGVALAGSSRVMPGMAEPGPDDHSWPFGERARPVSALAKGDEKLEIRSTARTVSRP